MQEEQAACQGSDPREGFLQCPAAVAAGTHIPQASPALTGLGFTYLILSKCI